MLQPPLTRDRDVKGTTGFLTSVMYGWESGLPLTLGVERWAGRGVECGVGCPGERDAARRVPAVRSSLLYSSPHSHSRSRLLPREEPAPAPPHRTAAQGTRERRRASEERKEGREWASPFSPDALSPSKSKYKAKLRLQLQPRTMQNAITTSPILTITKDNDQWLDLNLDLDLDSIITYLDQTSS